MFTMTKNEAKELRNKILGFDPENQKECLKAVNQSGLALQFVKDQTEEICLAAVKEETLALQYVKDQTPEICLAAIEYGYGSPILYINDIDKFINSLND